MVGQDESKLDRIQNIMTALLKRQIGDSLIEVDDALGKWKSGDIGEFEAHAFVLKHAARTERLAARMARIDLDSAGALMRDAYDLSLLDRDEFVDLIGCCPEDVEPSPPSSLDVDDETAQLPPKRVVVEQLLSEGPILVHVDARCAEVSVPAAYCEDPRLVLRFGYNLTPAIPDLIIDDGGVTGTLTFGGVPHTCVLPWPSVYAVVSEADHRGMVWPDDVPDSVVGELTATDSGAEQGSTPPEPDPPPPPPPPSGARKRRGSHLKLVK